MAVSFIVGGVIGGLIVAVLFMFAKRSIVEDNDNLEQECLMKDETIRNLENDVNMYEKKIEEIQKCISNSVPEGCVPGRWCKGCAFVKVIHVTRDSHSYSSPVYCCGKGESCKHFIPKVNKNVETN